MLTRIRSAFFFGLAVLGIASFSPASAIGLNYSVAGKPESELAPDDVAGADNVSQDHWNNLPGPKGTNTGMIDSAGKTVAGVTVIWDATEGKGDQTWRCKIGRDWGFKKDDLKLLLGYHQLGSTATIKGIPYAKYDVYVYLEADDNSGIGKVTLTKVGSSGEIDAKNVQFYKIGWTNGKFVKSEATTLEDASASKGSNMLVFSGNTTADIKIDVVGNIKGGWTGVTAVQIVDVSSK